MSEKDFEQKVHELQHLEQNMQSFLMQRQTIQVELNEVNNALEELKSANDEVYKVISGIMVRSTKPVLIKELEEKKKVLELRVSSIEKQEKFLEEKLTSLKKEINETVAKNQKKPN